MGKILQKFLNGGVDVPLPKSFEETHKKKKLDNTREYWVEPRAKAAYVRYCICKILTFIYIIFLLFNLACLHKDNYFSFWKDFKKALKIGVVKLNLL